MATADATITRINTTNASVEINFSDGHWCGFRVEVRPISRKYTECLYEEGYRQASIRCGIHDDSRLDRYRWAS